MQIELENASSIAPRNQINGRHSGPGSGASQLHALNQAREYLARVLPWPQDGEALAYINIHWTVKAAGHDKFSWRGKPCQSMNEAINQLDWLLKQPDVMGIYACMSSQREAAEKVSGNGKKFKIAIRSQENAVGLKSLFLDIDAKGHDKDSYNDLAEAVTALGSFLRATALPTPMTVRSGNGVHAYWPLDRALTVSEWQPLAHALVEATKQHGLKCDTGVTTDAARLLRIPGTLNKKSDSPKPVRVFRKLDCDYSVNFIVQALEPYKVTMPVVKPTSSTILDPTVFPPKPRITTPSELGAGIKAAMGQLELRACLDAIPNTKTDWIEWNKVGMRCWSATNGADYGLEEWQRWSDRNPIPKATDSCADRWETYHPSPPTRTGAGALVAAARAALKDPSWMPCAVPPQIAATTSIRDPSSFADPWVDFVGPRFPLHLLPPALEKFVEAEHRAMGADPSALAMAALTAVAGAMHAATCVRLGHGWSERPIIWTALIGQPSAMKSPIIQKVTNALHRIDQHRAARWQQLNAGYQRAKAAGQHQGPPPAKEARRLIQDATPEKIAEILSRASCGSMMSHDELAGWIGGFDRYGSGPSARAFYLTCWNGGPFLRDRVGQGVRDDHAEIRVDNLALSVLGGIQPDRLAGIRDLTSDGLLQRFLPVLMRSAERGDEDYPVTPTETEYEALIQSIQSTAPRPYWFAPDAGRVRTRVLDGLYDLEQLDGFSPALIGAIGKLKGYFGRIALVLHAAAEHDAVIRGQVSTVGAPISRQVAEVAETVLMDFLLPHVLGLYDVIANGGKDRDTVRAVAGFILSFDQDRLRPSDFTSGVRNLRGETQHKIIEWAGRFCALGWLRPEDETSPAPRAWLIGAGLREHFADRRKQVKAARAAAHEILRAGGTRRQP